MLEASPMGFRTLKSLTVLVFSLVIVYSCGGAEGERAPRIGLVTINQQALFFTQMIEGAQAAAADLNVALTVFNANNDPIAQNNAIENFTVQGFDGILVVAIDVEGIKPALRHARARNLKVVAVDAIVTDSSVHAQVGSDNRAGGEEMGRFLDWWARERQLMPARIGVVGALNSFIQIQRQEGFEDAVREAGHEILQVVDSRNVQEVALSATESLLTARSSLDAVYATGEAALVGAVAAARAQSASGGVSLFGWDLTSHVIRAIDDGFVTAVVQQDARKQGEEAVRAAVRLIAGEEVPSEIQVPIQLVTRENLGQFRTQFE
jgi:ribose transport system substrate-binding protein